MKKNQLFRKIPDEIIIKKVLNAFGYNNFNDKKTFSRKDLEKIKTVDKISELKPELEKYYLPCKSKIWNNTAPFHECLRVHSFIILWSRCYKCFQLSRLSTDWSDSGCEGDFYGGFVSN